MDLSPCLPFKSMSKNLEMRIKPYHLPRRRKIAVDKRQSPANTRTAANRFKSLAFGSQYGDKLAPVKDKTIQVILKEFPTKYLSVPFQMIVYECLHRQYKDAPQQPT